MFYNEANLKSCAHRKRCKLRLVFIPEMFFFGQYTNLSKKKFYKRKTLKIKQKKLILFKKKNLKVKIHFFI